MTEEGLPRSPPLSIAAIPAEDPAVYRMLQRADSLGVFQVESRAQMSMLPRLKPEKFYDLVIEVAIVRPGPIQGDMVHPYLRRKQGLEQVTYPSKELEQVLGKTLGVPLFQEQAMKIAIVAAGFTPSEADGLRRAMATFRKVGTIGTFQAKMVEGMVANGYDRAFAERCFKQLEGFGEYGFPESHAASFALLVYASCWMKCHYPDVFAAALLNAQPLGFYAPAQIVRDAREHGVDVRHPDVNCSHWDATLEGRESGVGSRESLLPDSRLTTPNSRLAPRHASMAADIWSTHAIRLGFREIKGLREDAGRLIAQQRGRGYDSVRDVWLRTGLDRAALERLADADAFGSLGLSRREALWAVKALGRTGDAAQDLPLFALPPGPDREPDAALPPMPPGEEVVNDYRFLRMSLKAHPVQFVRAHLDALYGMPRATNTEAASRVTPSPLVGEGWGGGDSVTPLESPPPCPSPTSWRSARGATGEGTINVTHGARIGSHRQRSSSADSGPHSPAIIRNESLPDTPPGRRIAVAGLVLVRQRPGSAKGVIFMTLEDEGGVANVIVWPKVFEKYRPVVLGARFVVVHGRLQSEHGIIHIIADRLDDRTDLLAVLADDTREVTAIARADEVKRPQGDQRVRVDAELKRKERLAATDSDRIYRKPRPAPLQPPQPQLPLEALDVPARATRHVLPKGRNFR